jgi:hypothetical protein
VSVELALAVAAVLLPIVLLLSFAGCASFGTQEAPPEPPAPTPTPDPPPVTPPPTPPPPNAPDNYHSLVLSGTELIAYWKLDEAASVSAAEDSNPGVKYHGTYIGPHAVGDGALRLGPDADDTAAQFDGSASHVEVPYQTLLNPASNANFSLEAWIAPDAAVMAAGRHVIVASARLNAAGTLERGFVLELIGGATPQLRGRVAPNGLVETALPPAVNGWYHVVMTYQAAATTLRLYVNIASSLQPRAADATANFTANRKINAADPAPPLRIGAGQLEPPTAATPPSQFFAGRIDNVALYRGLVTASQIRARFDAAQKP